MSPRFLIVRRTNPRRGIYKNRDVLELPDAEHIHVTRHPDGTITAVPMEASDGFERFVTTDEATGERYVGFRALTGLWVDSPGGAA